MKRLSITTTQKYNRIGSKVRQFRIEQKLSQQTLSARLETEAVYICRGSISRSANFTHSYGFCSKCQALMRTVSTAAAVQTRRRDFLYTTF